ncbi:MAG: thioredoxin fold domain-containing protein [Anaerolineales bacterium]|nr:thioredoxin fold domain-containing protein [Anaerolineales bacterium]
MNLSEFQNKISEAGNPVVVDFWATWCMPCKITKPILEKLAKEYIDRVDILPINADDSGELLKHFNIFGIPTVLTFYNGKEVGRVTGVKNEAGYRAMFNALVEGKNVKLPIAPFERMLRLGAGILLGVVGYSTNNWLVLGIGGLIAFLGVYDRCPVWTALTDMIYRR